MSKPTLSQGQHLLNLVSQSGIERDQLQSFLVSGRFSTLLKEYMDELKRPEPTITPITFALNYGQSLVQARDVMGVSEFDHEINDRNFPVEIRDSDREFVLVCFNRNINDNKNSEKSELLRELDRLGLEPEGPMELCFVGTDERTRDLQRESPIVARRQDWWKSGSSYVPMLAGDDDDRSISLHSIQREWADFCLFLCSRKPRK